MQTYHCPDLFQYNKRLSREVLIGNIGIGGSNPIRIQSMLTSSTLDTKSCVKEALALADAGCEIIRLTAQTKSYAANLENIVRELRAAGCQTPLVADIHFKPDAAMEAAKWVEKIRINPGNFIDKKKFEVREYSDLEYLLELERIRDAFTPLALFCKENGRAMRIGANHGSLSDRIINRYGDSPEGMVESALEFARIARELGYHQLVFSMKSSKVKVMIAAYRLLVKKLSDAGSDWNYPIHLGVTEAGEGEDARIKSAMGIGSLLSDGIGDTLRVSLTEDAIREIVPGFELAAPYQSASSPCEDTAIRVCEASSSPCKAPLASFDPFLYSKRASEVITALNTAGESLAFGGNEAIRVVLPAASCAQLSPAEMKDFMPEYSYESLNVLEIDPRDEAACEAASAQDACIISVADSVEMPPVQAFRLLAARISNKHPILLKDSLPAYLGDAQLSPSLAGGINIGSLLCDGIGNAVLIRREQDPATAAHLAFNILQAASVRISKAEFISCPSCGRTLYNIQEAAARIREATGHLKGVKIAIMGCIVNGPGEMSDADFGYVGGAPGKINLYVSHKPVEVNIPQEEAVARLIELIKSHGRWIEAK